MKKLPTSGYRLLRPILGLVFRLYYNPKIYGKENLKVDGSIIIAGNHKHIMDQCSASISTRRVIHYMAKEEYFEGKFAWFFKFMGCIKVDRRIKDKEAKETALNVLRDGGAIGLFPEGTRNKTDAFLLPFKFGCVSMASKTNATIIPFGVTGAYKFRSKNLKVRFGKPFKTNNMTLEEANKYLEKVIGSLMRENLK